MSRILLAFSHHPRMKHPDVPPQVILALDFHRAVRALQRQPKMDQIPMSRQVSLRAKSHTLLEAGWILTCVRFGVTPFVLPTPQTSLNMISKAAQRGRL